MFKEHLVFIYVPIASVSISSLVVDQYPIATTDDELIGDVNPVALDVAIDIPLRRSERAHRPVISYDYFVYL